MKWVKYLLNTVFIICLLGCDGRPPNHIRSQKIVEQAVKEDQQLEVPFKLFETHGETQSLDFCSLDQETRTMVPTFECDCSIQNTWNAPITVVILGHAHALKSVLIQPSEQKSLYSGDMAEALDIKVSTPGTPTGILKIHIKKLGTNHQGFSVYNRIGKGGL